MLNAGFDRVSPKEELEVITTPHLFGVEVGVTWAKKTVESQRISRTIAVADSATLTPTMRCCGKGCLHTVSEGIHIP